MLSWRASILPAFQIKTLMQVDWYAWGEEAFAKAKQEDKPIFLSVGYSTCHCKLFTSMLRKRSCFWACLSGSKAVGCGLQGVM